MTDTNSAWSEVGDHLSALALKLKLHAKEEYAEEEFALKDGFERISTAIDETFDALGDAYEDPAVRSDVRDAATSFRRALETTLHNMRAAAKRS